MDYFRKRSLWLELSSTKGKPKWKKGSSHSLQPSSARFVFGLLFIVVFVMPPRSTASGNRPGPTPANCVHCFLAGSHLQSHPSKTWRASTWQRTMTSTASLTVRSLPQRTAVRFRSTQVGFGLWSRGTTSEHNWFSNSIGWQIKFNTRPTRPGGCCSSSLVWWSWWCCFPRCSFCEDKLPPSALRATSPNPEGIWGGRWGPILISPASSPLPHTPPCNNTADHSMWRA